MMVCALSSMDQKGKHLDQEILEMVYILGLGKVEVKELEYKESC
jgi:hypothetical protein